MMNDVIDLLLFIVGIYADTTISELVPGICFPIRFNIGKGLVYPTLVLFSYYDLLQNRKIFTRIT